MLKWWWDPGPPSTPFLPKRLDNMASTEVHKSGRLFSVENSSANASPINAKNAFFLFRTSRLTEAKSLVAPGTSRDQRSRD